MMPARVSLVTLGVQNVPAMREFYYNLGWVEHEPKNDDFAAFKTGGAILCLYPNTALIDDANLKPEPAVPGFRGFTLAVNVETREMVDAAIKVVREAGGKILREPSDAFWGGRTSYFADPEGNIWEIAWNPAVKFDERGGPIWGQ